MIYTNTTHFSGIITRYDAATGQAVQVSKIPNTTIEDAQISRDGQWILFVAFKADHDELDIVRLDGQHMQTLLAAPPYAAISAIQWSPDQQMIAFNEQPPQAGPVITYLLDVKQNTLQTELTPPDTTGALYYVPRKWLDNTRLLMVGVHNNYDPPQNIDLLDTRKGAKQRPTDLLQLYSGVLTCGDFDVSADAAQLFVDTCTHIAGRQDKGASVITAYPLQGGASHIIFQSSTRAITQVRSLSAHTLLLLSRQELWTISSDGTALTSIQRSSNTFRGQMFNSFTQYGWSNVSRDGSLFALPSIEMGVDTHSSNLDYGLFRDGTLHTVASTYVGMVGLSTDVSLVGWTTF